MDKRFDFFKEQYYFELNRKNELTNSLAIPIGFLTVLFTGYAYFFFNLKYLDDFYLITIFVILIFVSIIFAIKALIHFYFSLHGLNYGYIPEPNKLYKYEQDYMNYVNAHGISTDKIDEWFFIHLKKSIVTTTNNNRQNNNFRANRILKANINTIFAIFFLFLSAIPFIINKNICDNKNNNQLKQTVMTTTDPIENQNENENQEVNPSLPEEPTFPVDQYITESLNIDIPTKDIEHRDSFPLEG